MTNRLLRPSAVAAAVLGFTLSLALALSGCAAAPSPGLSRSAGPHLKGEADIEDKGAPGTLTFEDGAALPPDAVAQWADGLATDDGWALTSPDQGQGTWAYTSTDDACTATFWQGEVYDMTAVDDVAASDFVLAALLDADASDLEGKVGDGSVGFVFNDNTTADYRFMSGGEPGHSWLIAVRGFAALTAAAYLAVDCTSDSATEVAESVLAASALHIIE